MSDRPSRLGKLQKQMLVWLLRTGPNTHVGGATPATEEISGWTLGNAVQVIKSLRGRGLVHCLPSGLGRVNLTNNGRALAEAAKIEVTAEREKFLSKFYEGSDNGN
jgi:DNA-binding MarR family transcriptional regulator